MVPSPGATGRRGTLPDLCRPRRIAARRPRAFGPLCRPEASCCENAVRRVGQPPWWRRRLGTPTSGRHALRDRAAHGTAPTCAMVPSPGATGRRGRSRTSAAQDNKRRVARGPSARCADRRPVAVKMQSGGSVKRLDGAARLGTPASGRHALRDRAAHGTAPTCAMVPSPGATGRRGRSRTSAAQDNKRHVARGPSARCAGRRPAFPAVGALFSVGVTPSAGRGGPRAGRRRPLSLPRGVRRRGSCGCSRSCPGR